MGTSLIRGSSVLGVVAAGAFLFASHARSGTSTTLLPDAVADASLASPRPLPPGGGTESVVLSGGCFWGMQLLFEHVKGVTRVVAGYAGGSASTATYDQVSTGTTGHAESVQITFDPSQVTFGQLLKVFFSVAHDPTELDRQGPDDGTQYRSVIFYTSPEQKRIATSYIAQLEQAKVFSKPIVTQVVPFKGFYPAEAYHQDFGVTHPDYPYIVINDLPKVEHLKTDLPALYRESRVAYSPRPASAAAQPR